MQSGVGEQVALPAPGQRLMALGWSWYASTSLDEAFPVTRFVRSGLTVDLPCVGCVR